MKVVFSGIGFCIVSVALGLGLGLGLKSSDDVLVEETTQKPTESPTEPPTIKDYIVETSYGDLAGYTWDPEAPYSESFIPEYMSQTVLPNEKYESIIFKGVPYAKPV